MAKFERKYSEDDSPKIFRDRFNVEFNKAEREMFKEAQLFLMQPKDATAIKQLAFYGWLCFSAQTKANTYLRDTLIINERRNRASGIDYKAEIEAKFHQLLLSFGGKT